MRTIILAVMAAGATYTTGSGPAMARDYPYCLQSRQEGIPGDCSYQSYNQCVASASGRNATCAINPRFAFSQPRRYRSYSGY